MLLDIKAEPGTFARSRYHAGNYSPAGVIPSFAKLATKLLTARCRSGNMTEWKAFTPFVFTGNLNIPSCLKPAWHVNSA
jgi:hypothetical protein